MKKNATFLKIAAGVVLLALVAVYFVFDPGAGRFFPKCLFRLVTGLPCPGCGSQRAVHSLLHLDIAGALRYNALVTLLLPFILLLAVTAIFKERLPRLHRITHHKYVAYAIGVLVVLWWILRISFGW